MDKSATHNEANGLRTTRKPTHGTDVYSKRRNNDNDLPHRSLITGRYAALSHGVLLSTITTTTVNVTKTYTNRFL